MKMAALHCWALERNARMAQLEQGRRLWRWLKDARERRRRRREHVARHALKNAEQPHATAETTPQKGQL